jgi:hypothetical protein
VRETSWTDCLAGNSAKKASPDTERAKSLKETAKERIRQISPTTEKNCNFVFEDYYTSVLEILQATAFEQGFNVLNHVCLGFFLRDALKREDLFILFDDARFKRNSLTYYGTRMDFETAKEAIKKCRRILTELEHENA